MKKRTINCSIGIIGIVMLLCMHTTYAQSPIWTLPNQYLEDANDHDLPTPSGTYVYAGEQAQYAHNAAYNPVTGKLLFFVVDNKVYDKDGYLINELIGIVNGSYKQARGISEISIVPDPGNCRRYYIFSSNKHDESSLMLPETYYSILDLDKQRVDFNTDRKGELINAENTAVLHNVLSLVPTQFHFNLTARHGSVHMAVSPKNSDGNNLVLIQMGNDYIYTFILTSSGLQYLNVFDPRSASHNPSSHHDRAFRRSELEIIPFGAGYRVAGCLSGDAGGSATLGNGGDALFTYDIGANGVYQPSTRKIYYFSEGPGNVRLKGIEFSPNGELIYFTHTTNSFYTKAISCINVSSWNTIVLNNISVAQASVFQYSQLEMAQKGKIYAATSNRLASINNPNNGSLSTWTNNALGLSNYTITTRFNDNASNLYLLPDQIDKQDCVVDCFESCSSNAVETACCSYYRNIDESSVSGYTVTSTSTWSQGAGNNPFGSVDGKVYFSGDLIIPAGKILTLDGMELYFAPNAKVIVQRLASSTSGTGGKLVLNGSTLSVDGRCGSCMMWQGVIVEGYTHSNQGFYHHSATSHHGVQGLIYLHNNSRIEHAMIGVYLGKKVMVPNVGNYSGGAVISENSSFFNNRRDVQFSSYSRQNRSRFTNTTFITDGALNNPAFFPTSHVFLQSVNNVNFFRCHFENTNEGLSLETQLGKGIESYESRFFVDGTTLVPTRFVNLHVGIQAIALTSSLTFQVDRSEFINNYKGIYVTGVANQTIQRNRFEVRKDFIPTISLSSTIGLHMINSTGYKVMENHFEEHAEGPSQGSTIGILVDNSGEATNEIYKNTFANLRVGGQSQNINASATLPLPNANNNGLFWRCNNFISSIYEADLAVTSGQIAFQQGFCYPLSVSGAETYPAGNKFSHSANNSMNDIWMNPGVLPINYAHHSDLSTTPLDYSQLAVIQECASSYNETTSCRSKIKSINGLGRTPLYTSLGRLKESLEEKESKIDGGNTATLIAQLSNSSLSIGEKKDKVVAASPYLTDAVLKYYLELNPPAGHVNQVVGLNSPVSAEIWSIVEDMNLSKGIKRQLENLQSGKSLLEELRNEYNYEKSEANLIVDELISSYLLDTTLVGAMDSVKFLYETEKTGITRVKNLTSWYLTQGDYTNAQAMLGTYIANYGEDNYTKIVKYTIEAETTSCATTYVAEEVSKKEMMEDIAHQTNDKKNCYRAQALLELALAQEFDYEVEPLIEMMGSRSMQTSMQTELLTTDEENEMIKLFPNPAKDEFFVVLDESSENLASVEITMYSFTGQQVKQIQSTDRLQTIAVPVNDLSQGMYLVVVTLNGEVVSQQKMAVK
jgi:hypothetical protein